MNIAFFGDIHGQVYHLLAAAITWQKRIGTALDMVIQVGDFEAERLEKMTQHSEVFLRYTANNPAEFDFLRVLYAQKQLAGYLREIRQQIQQPIYFLRGDHDEVAWLHQFSQGEQHKTIPIDPFDLFHYVPDGTIMHCGGMTLAFFGGVEHPERGKEGTEHDPAAFIALLGTKRGEVDVLITHEPPYGISTGFFSFLRPITFSYGEASIRRSIRPVRVKYPLITHPGAVCLVFSSIRNMGC